jgi:hypothetical protein
MQEMGHYLLSRYNPEATNASLLHLLSFCSCCSSGAACAAAIELLLVLHLPSILQELSMLQLSLVYPLLLPLPLLLLLQDCSTLLPITCLPGVLWFD